MCSKKTKVVALIPARGGSKRLPKKNIKEIGGHPLIAFTITAALESKVFDRVIVSTECEETAEIARYYGADIPFLRPKEMSADSSRDIDWVTYTVKRLIEEGSNFDCFSILRPTSPLRTPNTIRRAWKEFKDSEFDSLRAVVKCNEHPYKMWKISKKEMSPLFEAEDIDKPYHSSPYQSLPEVFVQNASLEIAWTRTLMNSGTIAGRKIKPFLTEGYEGEDINTEKDWIYIEHLLGAKKADIVEIPKPSYYTSRESYQ